MCSHNMWWPCFPALIAIFCDSLVWTYNCGVRLFVCVFARRELSFATFNWCVLTIFVLLYNDLIGECVYYTNKYSNWILYVCVKSKLTIFSHFIWLFLYEALLYGCEWRLQFEIHQKVLDRYSSSKKQTPNTSVILTN